MHIGLGFGFGKGDPALSDHDTYVGETSIALKAEERGYDSVWAVEHHFNDYAFCPDNLLWLSHIAARTSKIKLGTGAVILPWNTQPIRVAEKLLMLDHLSEGRVIFGMGRGLSRKEYAPFGVDLETSRDRFDEASKFVVDAIESGYAESEGPYYPQERVELRPRPFASWQGRMYTGAGTPESAAVGIANGAGLMSFVIRPVDNYLPAWTDYRDKFEAKWNRTAPPISINLNMYTDEDSGRANDRIREYVNRFYAENINHYEFNGQHFGSTKGYEGYAKISEKLNEMGFEKSAEQYAATALGGSPQEIVDKIIWMKEQVGDISIIAAAAFGGMPYEYADKSVALFAEKVIPVVKQHFAAQPVSV